ncbi:MAG TPA: extracellular solute-binding protein [Candidatus Binatia bacterium]|nr:extracellular solute-binding protein [Candidatus Binatia bacterium]
MLRLAFALLLAALSPQTMSAAKQEGTVVWYSSIDVPTLNAIVQRFQETHPGITVAVLRAGANQIPPRIMTEQAGGKFNADLVNGDMLSINQLVVAGALQVYHPTELGKFVKGSYDPNGYWSSIYNATTVIAWNPQKLKADGLQPPKSLADLAKPEWRGKIGLDSSAFNWYSGVLQTQPGAAEIMKKIAENKPRLTDGHTVTVTQLEAGEFDVTPTAYGYMANHERELGRPVDFLNPKPLLVDLSPLALVKNAPHPNAARVLIEWLLSKEGQQYIIEVSDRPSSRIDVKNPPRVWSASMQFYMLPAPDRNQYNSIVTQYKALLGVGG